MTLREYRIVDSAFIFFLFALALQAVKIDIFQKFFNIFFRVQRVTFPQAVVMALHSETVHGFSYDNVKIMAMTTLIRSQIASSVHLATSAQTLAIIGN